jgi:hypothetical protein
MDAELALEEMKSAGINGAVVRKDGILIHSTFAINETGAGLLAKVQNVSDALLNIAKDKANETEIAFGNLILVIIPMNDFLFCGAIKDREQKSIVRKYAQLAKGSL